MASLDFSTDDEEFETRNKNETGKTSTFENSGVDRGLAPLHGKLVEDLKNSKNGELDFSTDDNKFETKDQNKTGVFESDVLAPYLLYI